MNGVGIARDQRMPPIEVAALGHEAVAAARRQPVKGSYIFWRQPNAIGNLVGAVRIILASAKAGIEKLAGNVGEVDRPGILVLQLLQAATRAAVAQTLPFGVGHLLPHLDIPTHSI